MNHFAASPTTTTNTNTNSSQSVRTYSTRTHQTLQQPIDPNGYWTFTAKSQRDVQWNPCQGKYLTWIPHSEYNLRQRPTRPSLKVEVFVSILFQIGSNINSIPTHVVKEFIESRNYENPIVSVTWDMTGGPNHGKLTVTLRQPNEQEEMVETNLIGP